MRLVFSPVFFLLACASSEEGIKVYNSSPTSIITSHTDGTELLESTLYTFVGQVSDNNHTNAELVVMWTTDTRALCPQSTPNANGESTCQAVLETTDTKIQLQVTDPEGAAAISSVDIYVQESDAPTIEIISPASGGAYYSDQLIQFSAIINDSEDDPEDLRYLWTSNRDGELPISTTPDSDGMVSSFTTLSEGQHAISLRVEDSSGKTTTRDVAITVDGPNSEPQCSITTPEPGSGFIMGQNIEFQAMATDDNINNSLLQISWASDIDGVFNTTPPNTAGELTVVYDALSMGNHIVTLIVEDEVGAVCSDTVSIAVGTPPTLTIASPTSGAVFTLGDSISFVGTVSDEEDIPNEIAISWVSDLDGVFSTQTSDSNGNIAFGTSSLSAGTHNIIMTATDSDGLTTSLMQNLRVNTPPSPPSVSLIPSLATTMDNLEVSIVENPDLDGDVITYSYAWFKNGIATSYISTSIPSSATSYGDVWTVRVTPNDGYTDGAKAEASIVIENTPPTLDSVGITPSNAFNDSVLTCSGSASDADQSVSISYSWSVGSDTYMGATLDLSAIVVHPTDTITCTARVTDNAGATDSASDAVTLGNRAPVVFNTTISPTSTYTNALVSCSAGITDADGETPSDTVTWSVGNTQLGTGASLQLDSSMVSVGESLTCTVTANDGFGGTGTDAVSTIIQNTSPIIESISLSPSSPNKYETLICTATASDIDDETLSMGFAWENQTTGTTYTSTSSGAGTATLDLSTVVVSAQDVIACIATVSDVSSASATSTETITIVNSAPVFDVSASITPSTGIYTNTALSCTASAIDPDGSISPTYAWYNGTVLLSSGASYTILASETDVGDTISCIATAIDTHGEMTTSSSSVTIENTVPTLSGTTITPSAPYNSDTVTCTAMVSDPDESLVVEYTWMNNSSVVGTGSTLDLASTSVMPQDTLRCTASVIDTQGEGDTQDSSLIIANRAPSAPTISATPDPAVEGIDDLSCTIDMSSTDDDGNMVVYSYAWIDPDGVTQQTTLETSSTTDTYLASGTTDGIWTCEVTPSDGIDAGNTAITTLVVEPETVNYVGVIEMPESGTVNGYSSYWNCSSAMRTAIRVTLTENCTDPEIAIYQHSSSDTSIHGSYYIMDESGTVLDFSPFETHGNCNPSGQGAWCTPQKFTGMELETGVVYWFAFQNGQGMCDMSGPSVYTDSNARTIGIATFDQPRMDEPGSDTRGLPSSNVGWQNRWRLSCF